MGRGGYEASQGNRVVHADSVIDRQQREGSAAAIRGDPTPNSVVEERRAVFLVFAELGPFGAGNHAREQRALGGIQSRVDASEVVIGQELERVSVQNAVDRADRSGWPGSNPGLPSQFVACFVGCHENYPLSLKRQSPGVSDDAAAFCHALSLRSRP